MIPAIVERAVVKIEGTNGTLGTGFLISNDGAILTAKHVADADVKIRVAFRGMESVDADAIERGPQGEDWAVIRVKEVPPGIAPMPLGMIGSLAAEVCWYSVGHSRLHVGERGAFHGSIRVVAAELDLYCTELDGLTYDDARGLSGGPCIVDGEAVGLITDVLRRSDSGAIVAGQVCAIPMQQIKPPNVALLPRNAQALPWELVFRGVLEVLKPAQLLIAAEHARFANPVESQRLPQQIARRMINQGVRVTAEVLRQVGGSLLPAQVDEVMDAADTLWVDSESAESLAVIASGPVKVGLIATETDWSAQHHLRRAFASRQQGAIPWTHVVVDASHEEPFLDAVVERTYIELGRAMCESTDREAVKRRVDDESFATAFIVGAPRKDIVDALRADFPKLVIVFMSTAKLGVNPQTASYDQVTPGPTSDAEQGAQRANDDARARLRKKP